MTTTHAIDESTEIVAQFGPFTLTQTGVVVTGTPTYEEWQAATAWVQHVEKASPFWIGDLLAYGEAKFGEKYTQAIESTGHSVGYLMNVASVAQKIPPARRHPHLSFTHHQSVAALPEPEQDAWLDRAEVEDWSAQDLRTRIRVVKAKETGATVELGVWASCSDVDDQETLYAQLHASGRTVRKTTKEL